MTSKYRVGFLGAGGIARAHVYALESMKFYYSDAATPELISVASAREESRRDFARQFGFQRAESVEKLVESSDINTLFILGPNNTHFEHFALAMQMPGVTSVYLEKPVCSSLKEEEAMAKMAAENSKNVQVGFQYLQTPSVREALSFWKSGRLGKMLHFDLKYYHGDYLQASYRDKRKTRLTPAPDGGAMADLGSHGLSLLAAFFGNGLQVVGAMQSGHFEGVPAGSDLFSTIALYDPDSQGVGNMSASRISSGSGDLVYFELYGEQGALRYSSQFPDFFEYFLESDGIWVKQPVGSNYKGISTFPSGHVPAGWLRSLVHAHYLFTGGTDSTSFVPDLEHGLEVQRLVRATASNLETFRNNR